MSGYKRVNFYELCRLCATNQQKDKTHIFQEEGRKIQLQNKIQSCLSLKVCENDFLPKVVCSQCLRSLEECCLFRKECYSSETMLSSYFNNFRYTDDFKKSGKVYIKDTSSKVSASQTAACNTVGTNYNISVIPNTNLGSCVTQDTVPYYTLHLPTVVSQPPEPKIPPKEAKLTQPQIIYNLNTVKTAVSNLPKDNNDHVGNVTINSNGEIVTIAPCVDVNALVKQTLGQKICKLTKRPKMPEKTDIPIIDLTADPKLNFPPKPLVLQSTPVTHVHSAQKLSSYSDAIHFNSAAENVPNINPEPPPGDLYAYTGSSKQASTELINTNSEFLMSAEVKRHSCDICGKMFKRREHLYQHMKLHTGFRPFVCENCNKSFLRKEHLLRHMVAHSGQKNYTCTICEKSFSRNDNLLKHKKIHSKQNSFTCEICQKQFVMEHYYFAHKRTHDNEKCNQMWGLLKAI
ncbi:hypothetical protein PPYR_03415 [Photinus pyralis]|uniref:Uncharacterized protein n=2 Tax=Photinus pyralis TaxID=7054 RepID=A0A1Y1KXY6_PHOPY|nr:adult enhancer factor 1-like isoform X1 [Photinus pyralis]KAB0791615.1 hypothetical protein PPYR_03415 [Photinus pyralis]